MLVFVARCWGLHLLNEIRSCSFIGLGLGICGNPGGIYFPPAVEMVNAHKHTCTNSHSLCVFAIAGLVCFLTASGSCSSLTAFAPERTMCQCSLLLGRHLHLLSSCQLLLFLRLFFFLLSSFLFPPHLHCYFSFLVWWLKLFRACKLEWTCLRFLCNKTPLTIIDFYMLNLLVAVTKTRFLSLLFSAWTAPENSSHSEKQKQPVFDLVPWAERSDKTVKAKNAI